MTEHEHTIPLQVLFDPPSNNANAFATLFRKFLVEKKVSEDMWNEMISNYIQNLMVSEKKSDKNKSKELTKAQITRKKNDISRRFKSPDLSWDTFLEGMKMLGIDKISLAVGTGDNKLKTQVVIVGLK